MKKIASMVCLFLFMGMANVSLAQSKVKEVKKEVKKDAKKVGHKTAEVASKGKAKVTDKEYKDKVGPNNETIYIDDHSKYYWIDKKGHRHYVTDTELKTKEEQ